MRSIKWTSEEKRQMKKIIAIIIAGLVFMSISQTKIFAQNSAESSIKSALNNLLDYSKSKSYDMAVKLIAFDVQIKTDVEKVNQAKRICKKINALVDLSSRHEFGEFKITGDAGKEIYTMQIVFISGDQKLVTAFNFIKSESSYLLTNMN
jgi:hypothetical protein